MFEHSGNIIWLTGLPALGRRRLPMRHAQRLKAGGARVQVLDGDIIRAMTVPSALAGRTGPSM